MRLMRRPIPSRVAPDVALAMLDARATDRGLPPPAALTGDWFSSRAVIAPSVRVDAVSDKETAFTVPTRQPEPSAADDAVRAGAVGGGWFGYLGYDLTDPSRRNGAVPAAAWGWADHVLRLDADGQWWFEAILADSAPDPVALADELAALLTRTDTGAASWRPSRLTRPDGAVHTKAVRACMDAIAEGELFQANVCARFHGEFSGSTSALFCRGIAALRPRRAAYLTGEWGTLVSLSPELFLARRGRRVRSTPIKGTLPRRNSADDVNAALLRRSSKDVAENVMITDLVRNDLGRVSAVGSVRVPELLVVRAAPGVWHLESSVESELADGVDDAELLRAAFPPGSVTGAPKLRALELIAELEAEPRGAYCGAIGLASPIAGLELNVAIRTFEIAAGRVALGVGGGITALSEPAAEWQECLHKAAPLEALLAEDAVPPAPGG